MFWRDFAKMRKTFAEFFRYKPPSGELSFELSEKDNEIVYDDRKKSSSKDNYKISENYDKNLEYIKKRFNVPRNSDVVIKEVIIGEKTRAFVVFYDGMSNGDVINSGIIKPLLEIPLFNGSGLKISRRIIKERLLIHNQVSERETFNDVINDINFGSCGIFVEGIEVCFSADVKGWPHRTVQKAENEQSLYGPQEAFADMLRGNSAQVRKYLKTEKLICEGISVGNVSKTPGVIMYLSDVANSDLVDEVRRRINGISVDYVISAEEVSLLVEENPLMITGHILATERPDRVARSLVDGRVAMILNGSPRALIFPTNAYEMTHSASDSYLRTDFANMSRIIRIIATMISVLLPGLFLAVTMFHEEMLPTYLLYAISASRQNVPFPSVVELLLMDISFEMIREAGVRMPGPIGSILGIVGGLILGQAAVSAKIVSPIMIIIIAITGIGSFATADYSLGWSYRILKIVFVILAALFGFYGIALGIFVYAMLLGSSSSFGIPFLSPLPGDKFYKNTVFVPPLWTQEKRPEFLSARKRTKEDKISKKWTHGK